MGGGGWGGEWLKETPRTQLYFVMNGPLPKWQPFCCDFLLRRIILDYAEGYFQGGVHTLLDCSY